jgi:hypothetical protein
MGSGAEPYGAVVVVVVVVVAAAVEKDDDQSHPMNDVGVVAEALTIPHDHDIGTLDCETQYKSPRLVPMTIMGTPEDDDTGQCTNKLVMVASASSDNGGAPTIKSKRGLKSGRDHSEGAGVVAVAAASTPLVGRDTFHSTSGVSWDEAHRSTLILGWVRVTCKSSGKSGTCSESSLIVVIAESGCCSLQSNVV